MLKHCSVCSDLAIESVVCNKCRALVCVARDEEHSGCIIARSFPSPKYATEEFMCHTCLRNERRLVPVSSRNVNNVEASLNAKQYVMSSTNPAVTDNRVWPNPLLIVASRQLMGDSSSP